MSIEAMKQALEALEYVKQTYDEQGLVSLGTNTAIIDLRQAIAELEKQEPVAIYQYQLASGSWIDQTKESHDYNVRHGQAIVRVVYTTPQPQREWVGLTDEQIEKGRDQTFSINNPYCPCDSKTMRKAVRWAEAKLKEKNT